MLKVERTNDVDLVRSVMGEMWDTVAEDGQDQGAYIPDLQSSCWLHVTDGDTVAVYQMEKHNSILFELHAQVLPEKRKRYSIDSGHAVLDWIRDNVPECRKLIAWVPVIYPNVRAFVVAQGFSIEGNNTDSYLKNGKLHDQTLLGLRMPTGGSS